MKKENILEKKIEIYAGIEKVELTEYGKILLDLSTVYGDFSDIEVKGGLELSIKLEEGSLLEATLIPKTDKEYDIYSLKIPNGALIYQRKSD